MQLFQFPLVRLFIAYILGIIIAFQFRNPLDDTALFICLFLLLFSHLPFTFKYFSPFPYLFFLILGYLFLHKQLSQPPLAVTQKCECRLTKKKQKHKRYLLWFKCKTENNTSFQTEINWKDQDIVPNENELFQIRLTLDSLHKQKFTSSFNYNDYLKKNGILSTVNISNAKKSGYVVIKTFHPVQKKWRENWIALFQSSLSPEAANLVPAILFGDKSNLSKDTRNLFSQAGIIHILAVSGLHVGMLYLLIFRSLFWLGKRPIRLHIRNGISLVCLIIYAWICGFSPSISRAVLMFAIIFSTKLFLKNSPTLHQLIVSAFILLIYEPLWLFQLGFQFSYIATAGILIGLKSLDTEKQYSKISTFIRDSTMVSIAAQTAVIPISLFYFYQIPIWFFLTNIPAFILAFLLLLFSISSLVFQSSPSIFRYLILPVEWCSQGLFFLIQSINYLPVQMIEYKISSLPQLAIVYLLLGSLYLFFLRKQFNQLKWILIELTILLLL